MRAAPVLALVLALLLTLQPPTAQAEGADPPLSAQDFEAIVQGRTFDTLNLSGRYGVETFLPGRRAIWRDAGQCLEGTWRAEGEMICFDYLGEPFPYCWTYHDRGGWLVAWLNGDRSREPITLQPADEVVTCEGFFGV